MILSSGYWPDIQTNVFSKDAGIANFEVDDFTIPGIQEWVDAVIDEWLRVRKVHYGSRTNRYANRYPKRPPKN